MRHSEICVRVFPIQDEATRREGCSEVRTFELRCKDQKELAMTRWEEGHSF